MFALHFLVAWQKEYFYFPDTAKEKKWGKKKKKKRKYIDKKAVVVKNVKGKRREKSMQPYNAIIIIP